MVNRYHYRKMTAAEFSAALDRLGLSARQFARLSGAQPKRVLAWLEDSEAIAPYVPVLLALLAIPGAMDVARSAAEAHLIAEEPDDD